MMTTSCVIHLGNAYDYAVFKHNAKEIIIELPKESDLLSSSSSSDSDSSSESDDDDDNDEGFVGP